MERSMLGIRLRDKIRNLMLGQNAKVVDIKQPFEMGMDGTDVKM